MSGIVTVLWIVFSTGVWVIYRKIFTVDYFNLSQGLMKDLFLSAFVGMILTGLTLHFWGNTAIILLLVGFGFSRKRRILPAKRLL